MIKKRASKEIPKKAGIYALMIALHTEKVLNVGSLGKITLRKGVHAYVGSARGPGGLRSRISRHLQHEKKLHWHIDYLLLKEDVEVSKIAFYITEKDLECSLVKKLIQKGAKPTIDGFGSSDCNCESHLLRINPSMLQKVKIQKVRLDIIRT